VCGTGTDDGDAFLVEGEGIMQTASRSLATQLVIIAGAGLLGTTSPSSAQTSQNQNSYTAFVSAVAALAASADDLVANERTAARQVYVRQKVTDKVLAAFPSNNSDGPKILKLDDVLDPKTLLCDFRWRKQWAIVKTISARDSNASITLDQLVTTANQSYLSGAVKYLNAAATPANTSDPISAFKVLFGSPSSVKLDPSKKPSVDDETRKYIQTSCEKDLGEFEAAYYGEPIPIIVPAAQGAAPAVAPPAAAAPAPTIPDLSFLGPSGAAITTAFNIISSVIESFAALKADSDAAAKVSTLLRSDQAPLTQGGHDLARTGSDYLFAKRMALAGQFAEQIALVQADAIDLTSAEVQAACPKPYSEMYTRGAEGKGLLNPAFMRCHAIISNHYDKGIQAALQAALAYDQLADTGDTSTALDNFEKMTAPQSYQNIVQNGFKSTDNFWQEATKLVTFAGAVATTASPASIKKLEQSFEAAKP
jgi:hypothetical protein